MLQGLTQDQFAIGLRDLATPLAVSRLEIIRRNPKLGSVLLHSPKAPRLARNILRASRDGCLDEGDVKNMMAAAEKRRRKFSARVKTSKNVSASEACS